MAEAVDFKEMCFRVREHLIQTEPMFRQLQDWPTDIPGESRANVMLAFRHLEDCRMRLGKAIQAYDGGTSVYPR
jgi:hypothetical protein